jgi:tetraacyldisaccharide 4'-kinase
LYSTIKKPEGLPARVISVGNLTLGGTGKTPATIAIACEARRRGLNPCILTRGYRGSGKGPCLVTMGNKPLIGPSEAGDEAYLMAEKLKDVAIVKDHDRHRGGIYFLDNLKSRIPNPKSQIIFILDDGFQHWKLKRDIDIVLIDSSSPLKEEHLLPEGRLREPLSALERADIIVLTKIEDAEDRLISDNIELIRRYNPSSPVYRAYFRPSGLIDIKGNIEDTDRLKGNRVYAFAGIANPSHFRSMLISLGADLTGFRRFMDHHNYTENDLRDIEKDAKGFEIITTEKDMVKLKNSGRLDNLHALRIEFTIDQDFYDRIFNSH